MTYHHTVSFRHEVGEEDIFKAKVHPRHLRKLCSYVLDWEASGELEEALSTLLDLQKNIYNDYFNVSIRLDDQTVSLVWVTDTVEVCLTMDSVSDLIVSTRTEGRVTRVSHSTPEDACAIINFLIED